MKRSKSSGARLPDLEILLLGPLEIRRSGKVLEFPPSRKTRALLAYLVATGRPHARERLCNLLWEGPVDPRRELRWSLSKLRPLVEADGTKRLVTKRDRVEFEPNGAEVDLLRLREHVGPAPERATTEGLETAADLFRGTFLEGLDLGKCRRFEAWCTGEREASRSRHIQILSTLVERLGDGQPEDALRYARERLVQEPHAESAHLAVIRLLGRLGRTRDARQQYETCCKILRREFGAGPSRELEAANRALGTSIAPAPADPAPPAASSLPPLVGRRNECESIEAAVEQSARGESGPILLVTGDPGIGKTRLLEELSVRVHEAGGEVLGGRGFEAEMIRPYGPWVDALRAIPRDEIALDLRRELVPLLPELGAAPADTMDRIRLFEAVTRLLAGRADQRLAAIVLDDLQWVDEASVALLHFVARRLHGTRTLFALAARPAELADNPVAGRFLRALEREDRVRRLELRALDGRAVEALVHRIDGDVDAEGVFEEGEGNPLFTLEIAHALHEGQGPSTRTLEGLIEGRLARLDQRTRDILPWLAAFGHGFTLELLSRVLDLSSSNLLSAIEQLERHNVIRPSGAGHDFTHDLIRRTAYRRISEPRRLLIHSRIAHALAEIVRIGPGAPDGDPDYELAGDVAHHAALGGDDELAACASLVAGRHALWLFAYDDAAELVARGIERVPGLPEARRIELHVELLALMIRPEMKDHRFADLEEDLVKLINEARSADLQTAVHRGLDHIANLTYQTGDFTLAMDQSLRAAEAGREADPETVARAIAETSRCLSMMERNMDRAEELAYEAEALAAGMSEEFVEIPHALGHVHHYAGRMNEASAAFTRAVAAARRQRDHWDECYCLSRLVMIDLEDGRAADALERCRELRPVAARIGDDSQGPYAEALEALGRLALAEDDAVAALEAALQRLRDADTKAMLAYVQVTAGEIELENGAVESARRRAEEALESASAVKRGSTIALARALLAACSLAEGNPDRAAEYIDAVRAADAGEERISKRAREAVDAAARRLEKTPT